MGGKVTPMKVRQSKDFKGGEIVSHCFFNSKHIALSLLPKSLALKMLKSSCD